MNSTGLGPRLDAVGLNVLINASDTDSETLLSNLAMTPNWVGWLTVRKTGLKFKMTLMNRKRKKGVKFNRNLCKIIHSNDVGQQRREKRASADCTIMAGKELEVRVNDRLQRHQQPGSVA